ncbi:hypothetical protein [Methylobacterium aerolatum]|uniref:Uncharacterized protein n=1 Tax=Methylobacterium aerolatum TaxID=418708 RepID=A0ABU0HZA9_9HYPH|nr:hypothetical protein [Methylobacterium aerolatum]MDQ0446816.1 hypothetical protein [Methylobacterium aerolatum]GJD33782.1 hypothetical protein FMGBMHLM_0675 [Methylobacterium aerolatum]
MGLLAFILIGGPWVAATAWAWHRAGGVEAWKQVFGDAPPSR